MMAASLSASRCALIVVSPVTPAKSRVAASARRTEACSVVPARPIASATSLTASYVSAARPFGTVPYLPRKAYTKPREALPVLSTAKCVA